MSRHGAVKTTARVLRVAVGAWVLSALVSVSFVSVSSVIASPVSAQEWRDVSLSRVLGAQELLNVRVRYGAGTFEMAATDDVDLLYGMELRYDEEQFEPVAEYADGSLEVGVESMRRSINFGKRRSQARMDLRLTPQVPLRLDVEVGAAEVDVDLTGLSIQQLEFRTGASRSVIEISEPNPIRMSSAEFAAGAAEFTARGLGNLNTERLRIDAGVGDVTLDFTGNWQGDTRAEIDMGLGALELRFPRDLGVKLMKDSFLTSFDARGMVKRGDAYYSEGYSDATYRMEIEVDAAFGSIEVVWLN
ncbi:MAG: hypothetical protein ACI9OJ_004533 [Myxococcota bacterium]|jgi:hypothetical protein